MSIAVVNTTTKAPWGRNSALRCLSSYISSIHHNTPSLKKVKEGTQSSRLDAGTEEPKQKSWRLLLTGLLLLAHSLRFLDTSVLPGHGWHHPEWARPSTIKKMPRTDIGIFSVEFPPPRWPGLVSSWRKTNQRIYLALFFMKWWEQNPATQTCYTNKRTWAISRALCFYTWGKEVLLPSPYLHRKVSLENLTL